MSAYEAFDRRHTGRAEEAAAAQPHERAGAGRCPPAVFFWLQPIGQANLFLQAVLISTLLLHTKDLAQDSARQVWLMPWLVSIVGSAGEVAGVCLGLHKLFTGIFGQIAGAAADVFGMKMTTLVMAIAVMVGAVLTANTQLFLPGLMLATLGTGALQTTWQALFSSQFDDSTQVYVSYAYALQNLMWFCATALAGIVSFSVLCLVGAVLMAIGVICFWCAPVTFKDTTSQQEVDEGPRPPLTASERRRVLAFVLLMLFSLLFLSLFPQFLGGPFLLFADESVGKLGPIKVQPEWYISLNGFIDMLIAILLAWVYTDKTKFYTKLMISFVFLGLACGLVSIAAALWPGGGVSPLFPALSIVLVSFGELHHMPVIMAAIATEMPRRFLGLFTGIYFLIYGVGGFFGSVGVDQYRQLGTAGYFGWLAGAAGAGIVGFMLALPFFRRTFSSRSGSGVSCEPLGRGAAVAS